MSKFYLPTSTSPSATSTPAYTYSPTSTFHSNSDDDEDTLPYPGELARNDFLQPDFDPQTYLSSLRNRHQTLEDLRSDLRQRSQLLNQELLDLVNGNYEEFLSLGGDLKGGEERVEGVRVGLLGFRREVEGIRKAVGERLQETGDLLEDRKGLRRDVVLGRALLEVGEKLVELEASLGITENEEDGDDETDLDDEDDELDESDASATTPSVPVRKLQRHTQQYILITRQVDRIGPSHPFLQAQRPRLDEVKKTLLLDLAAALRQAKAAKAPDAILAVVRLYGDLGAESESVRILKGG